MQELKTEIIIRAKKEKVWEILTSFNQYSEWNPFIIDSKGEAIEGGKLTNTMLLNNKKQIFTPKITSLKPTAYLEWLGSLWIKGLFDGRHYFELHELSDGELKLVHGERFSGLLHRPILKMIKEETLKGFIAMNDAIKNKAENTLG